MRFTDLDIITLYKLKKNLLKESYTDADDLQQIEDAISIKESVLLEKINEDTSATGGLSVGGEVGSGGVAYATQGNISGMGSVVSAQPGVLPGTTGTIGSGDVSVPFNAGPGKIYQKIPIMGYYHGSRTGRKSRIGRGVIKNLKKMKDMKSKKDTTGSEPAKSKIWSFDDFAKSDINKVKK